MGTAPPRPARTVASPVPALTGHNCPAAVDGGDGVAGVAGAVVVAGLEEGGAEGGAELLLFLYQLASFDKLEMEVVTYFFLQRNTPPSNLKSAATHEQISHFLSCIPDIPKIELTK